MKTFTEIAKLLKGKDSRRLWHEGRATWLEKRGENVALRYHETDVVTWKPDGWITLNSGGWRTMTTKARINEWTWANIWTERGVWYVSSGWGTPREARHVFVDGMEIHENGSGMRGEGKVEQATEELKWRKAVNKFASEYVAALKTGDVGAPSGGDCFYCGMKVVGTGQALGDVQRDGSHLRSHIEERYFVPSLVWNAFEATGASQAMKWWVAARQGVLKDEKGEKQDFNDSGGYIARDVAKHIAKYVRLRTEIGA